MDALSFMTADRVLFTSESVSEGHPDKLCDQVSDAMLDECIIQDPDARVACETATTTGTVFVAGEITTSARPTSSHTCAPTARRRCRSATATAARSRSRSC